jgi:hypothetical protein
MHSIISNDIVYMQNKQSHMDRSNVQRFIQRIELYCNTITFEEQIKQANEIDTLGLLVQNNSWCIQSLDNYICELYYEFSSMESDRWFHRKINQYGINYIYYIQYLVQVLYENLLQVSPDYLISILDVNAYDYDIDHSRIECIQGWLLEGEEISRIEIL